jgi:signal transduction histidine kinase
MATDVGSSKHIVRKKKNLILFLSLAFVVLAQAVWWIVFMAQLVDEKVKLAMQFGADQSFIDNLNRQEVSRQIMVGLEGIFFLILILAGAWLIYSSLLKAEELKFHQQNFLMAVTHELKTPLASIRIYLQSLKSPKISDETKDGIIPKMTPEITRLEKLVENILNAGRFERSGYHLRRETINLSNTVRYQIENLKKMPTKSELRIEEDIVPNVNYYGDQQALGQALDAILENGLKYNVNGIVILKISLATKGKFILLTVSDNGIGLEKKDTSRIFNRFYRVGDEMSRSYSGTGLGLFLAREIVRQHGGDLTAESPGLGQGTTVTMKLKIGKK